MKGDGFSLPFKDESFDVVYSEGVIEHFPIDRSTQMIREHARVCRTGGSGNHIRAQQVRLSALSDKASIGPEISLLP